MKRFAYAPAGESTLDTYQARTARVRRPALDVARPMMLPTVHVIAVLIRIKTIALQRAFDVCRAARVPGA
jgi:hypothetical protein